MIGRADLARLSAPQKAALIYGQARAELSDRLWRAALGDGDSRGAERVAADGGGEMSLDSLLALLEPERREAGAAPQPSAAMPGETFPDGSGDGARHGREDSPASDSVAADGLGVNARHLPVLTGAAARTGIPAPALAAIIQAEAAKGPDGSWQLYSRNPRSSAAGLGQFLSGTWEGMAERKGTWLNQLAEAKGWLDGGGRVVSAARSALLSLRYDAEASINTVADYARQNLDGLRRAGVAMDDSAAGIARSAYLGHHLGLGDAIRFAKGGLHPSRAQLLLGAQVGAARASRQIAEAGGATAAHHAWLVDFVSRHVRPERFAA